MNIIKSVLGVVGLKDSIRFNSVTRDPEKAQNQLLKKIIADGRDTLFGKEHNFSSINSPGSYASHVPVSSYDDLSPYIKRLIHGEKKVLTPEEPIFFATTSGTTGEPKFIPVTLSSRNAKSQIMRLWLYYASKSHPSMFSGKVLSVVSPEAESYTDLGIPCGAESGHAYKNMPSILKAAYAAPYEVFAIEDYDLKYYILLRLAMQESITFIGTVNPSTIILLCKKIQEFGEGIIKDIHDGACRGMSSLAEKDIEVIKPYIKADPERAKVLEQIMNSGEGLTAGKVWPELALIGCWKGGSVGIYLRDFLDHFDEKTPSRDWGYLASEIRGSIPISDESASGVLTVETNYYEFVQEDEINDSSRQFIGVADLEQGRRYYVFPTTTAGLYRYEMNDIIEVTGFYNKTPLLSFCQKGKGVSSLTGEKLYESQVVKAVQNALEKNSLSLEFIVLTVHMESVPAYVCIVEETRESINGLTGTSLINDIDLNLQNENIEYEGKRKSGRLGNPVLKVAYKGEYEKYRRRRVAEGVPDGQFKMLKLNSDFEFQKMFSIEKEFIAGK
jgi:hypothetical protein